MHERYEVTLHGGPYDKRKVFVDPSTMVYHMPKERTLRLEEEEDFTLGTVEYYAVSPGWFVYQDSVSEDLKKYVALESRHWVADNTNTVESVERIMHKEHDRARLETLFTIRELAAIDLNIVHAQGIKIQEQKTMIENLRSNYKSAKDLSTTYRKALQRILGDDINVHDFAMRISNLDTSIYASGDSVPIWEVAPTYKMDKY